MSSLDTALHDQGKAAIHKVLGYIARCERETGELSVLSHGGFQDFRPYLHVDGSDRPSCVFAN